MQFWQQWNVFYVEFNLRVDFGWFEWVGDWVICSFWKWKMGFEVRNCGFWQF
jgi:hypothetical protein